MKLLKYTALLSAAILAACAGGAEEESETNAFVLPKAFPSTYEPLPSDTVLITNALIIDGTGKPSDANSILMSDGKISEIGNNLRADAETVIDAEGRFVTPGIIDIHSHLGNYPSPGINAHNDGNEITSPITSEVDAEHGVWPHEPGRI